MAYRILVVEDDEDIGDLWRNPLHVQVTRC